MYFNSVYVDVIVNDVEVFKLVRESVGFKGECRI